MHDSVPVKVCTGVDKIYPSFQTMRAKDIEDRQIKVRGIRYLNKDVKLIESRQKFAQAIVAVSKRASASSKICRLARSMPQKPSVSVYGMKLNRRASHTDVNWKPELPGVLKLLA
jgi:hypothetical protein